MRACLTGVSSRTTANLSVKYSYATSVAAREEAWFIMSMNGQRTYLPHDHTLVAFSTGVSEGVGRPSSYPFLGRVQRRLAATPLGVGATGEKEVVSKYVHSEAQEAVQRQLRVPLGVANAAGAS